jgi:hypothetical protein
MKGNEIEYLSHLAGQTEGVLFLPLGRPCGRSALNAILIAGGDIISRGFPLKYVTPGERNTVAALRNAGLIETSGATRAAAARLTQTGIFACWQALGTPAKDILAFVERVRRAKTAKTPWGADVVLGSSLLKSAGPWWSRASLTDKAWQAYQHELTELEAFMLPATALSWIERHVAENQTLFALSVTEEGRAAAVPKDLPQVEIDGDSWEQGFEASIRTYTDNPPKSQGRLARLLPDSAWI